MDNPTMVTLEARTVNALLAHLSRCTELLKDNNINVPFPEDLEADWMTAYNAVNDSGYFRTWFKENGERKYVQS